MDADGSHRRCLGGRGNGTAWPAWEPDGSTIVFARSSDLWSIDVDAAAPSALNLTRTSNIDENYPAWSPDGSSIAYDRHVLGGGHTVAIYAMAPDGTGRHALTDGSLASHDADWSPDGMHIVFQLYLDASTNVLTVMDADGSNQHVILNRSVADAVFSPDGQRIAFTLLAPPNLVPAIGRIWADGSHFTRIIADPAGGSLSFPSWQPR
jgi:Tol biopolymer transport system component